MALKRISVCVSDVKECLPPGVLHPTGQHNPTARAIRRATKKGPEVFIAVWTGFCRIGKNYYRLPREVDAAERQFIQERRLIPYEFLLDNTPVPDPLRPAR